MVSRAQVLSASRPDFRDIITRQASGVPGIKTTDIFGTVQKEKKIKSINNVDQTLNDKRALNREISVNFQKESQDQ